MSAALVAGAGFGCSSDENAKSPAAATNSAGGAAAGSAGAGGVTAGGSAGSSGGSALGGSAGATSAGAGGAAGAAGAVGSSPNKPWDWTGIVGTGQSLSVGANGTPLIATTQPYANLKLALGNLSVPPYDASSSELTMVPLVEPIHPLASGYPSAYPYNLYGESPHTAMANQISALYAAAAAGDYVSVHTVVGESGQGMTVIEKGATDTGTTGHAYAATLFEAEAIARLAQAAGKKYGIGAIIITHGESDAGNDNYASDLYQLVSDYNADLAPLTGQTQKIPMLVTQQHSVPDTQGSTSASTLAQWKAGVDHPGEVVCSGPKYQYEYSTDHIHLTAASYDRLGEKYGQVFFERVVLGNDWQPLQPTSVQRNGNVITVNFHVPVGPLAWDETMPAPHQSVLTEWKNGRGFEVAAGGTRVGIDSVEIAGDALTITCSSDPGASGVVVRYAMTADGTPMPGGTSRWGQLRDSDPFVGATSGTAQPNYAVAFELPVP